MRYFETFAGVGGFGLGIRAAVPGANCVGVSENDEHASLVLRARMPSTVNVGDITKVQWGGVSDFDLLTGGVPCQAWSIAGNRGGFADPRGGMWAEFARALREKRPRFFIAENVLGLLSHDRGRSFEAVRSMLESAGYLTKHAVLTATDHGVPQKRQRVFIAGFLKRTEAGTFARFRFPGPSDTGATIARILERAVPEKYWLKQEAVARTLARLGPDDIEKVVEMASRGAEGAALVIRHLNDRTGAVVDTVAPTMRASHDAGRRHPIIVVREPTRRGWSIAMPGDTVNLSVANSETRRGRVGRRTASTLDTGCNQAVVVESPDGISLRRLTPIECERLQGWPDGWTATGCTPGMIGRRGVPMARQEISDSQRYRMAGNGVAAPVVAAVVLELRRAMRREEE